MSNKFFFVFDHQGKSGAFVRALESRGWERTKSPRKARFVLSDSDISTRGRTLEELDREGKKIFLYPHTAIPSIFWDFPQYTPSRSAAAQFVPAPGHAAVMRAISYPRPVEVVGWNLSTVRLFRGRREIRNIVFAPIHPNRNGFLSRVDQDMNRETFERARSLSVTLGASLTIRYLGDDLRSNGLWKAGGIIYIHGSPDGSTVEIERADLVISRHTLAYMAVALGIPTLMMGEGIAPRIGDREDRLRFVEHWENYREIMRYPLDILEGDPLELAKRATENDSEICEWRERMIGSPFLPNRFVDRLESYL